jgi:S-DNA-T family DNA segregation ATPase FtsK/SpoIIIE
MFILPLAFLLIGIGVLLRHLGDRLPTIEVEQWIGAALLFLLCLALFHAIIGASSWDVGRLEASQGHGGGYIGAAILALFVNALGAGGAAVALTAWLLIALILMLGVSVPDLLGHGYRWTTWLRLSRQFKMSPLEEPAPPSSRPVQTANSILVQEEKPESPEAVSDRVVLEDSASRSREWNLPELGEILEAGAEGRADETFDRERGRLIEETLHSFGAPARVVEINRGPVITQFGVEPDFLESRGGRRTKVKVSKISALADDLALALAAPSIRIEAPVPGKGFVGIEVPNMEVSLVALRDVMESSRYKKIPSALRIGLGKDVSGKAVAADLAAMPHLLIAGTTGSGKSVCVNAIISCLLLQNTPQELRFVMVDPKRVELTYYNGIPHLLSPVVVDLDRVVPALQWISREMDRRYHLFSKEGVRNITDFNSRMENIEGRTMHYIVVVIDELADLMMLAPDETERAITRLAQLARATGIHLVIATQRPSVDVVTGLIKANFPSRIAFAVASSVDSRVILDQPGAERLLGRGDMLFQAPDAAAPIRMQGAFVSETELARLIRYWKFAELGGEATQPTGVEPSEGIPPGAPLTQAPLWDEGAEVDSDLDPLFNDAVRIVREMRRASISLLQRRLRIGYTRSARLVDQMEEKGIIGPAQRGSQPREVLDYGSLEVPDEGT